MQYKYIKKSIYNLVVGFFFPLKRCFCVQAVNADISYYTDNKNKKKYLYARIIVIFTITLDLA